MDVVALFVADAQASEVEQPGKEPFHHATMFSQSAAMFGVAFGDERLDAAPAQRPADFVLGVVGPISERLVGSFASAAAGQFDRRYGVDQCDRLLGVMDVRARVCNRQRRPLPVAHNMPLRAIFATIGGVRAGLRPPKSARTEQLSSATLLQSISSAKPSSSRNTRQIFSQMPAICQSRNRRQQVMPDPQPISCGKYSQGQPDRRTNRMPVNACRSETRGRPPLGRGGTGGNSGSMRDHNSSVSSGVAMTCSSLNTRQTSPITCSCLERFC